MSDITKLPKWAQAYIAERRVFETHLWPQFERPETVAIDWEALPYGAKVPLWFPRHDSGPQLGYTRKASHNFHGTGIDSQGAAQGYATPLEALKATRYRMSEECARKLACIDAMIEEERAKVAKEQA